MKIKQLERIKHESIEAKKLKIREITQKNKNVDIVFLLDSRLSSIKNEFCDKIEDLAFDLLITNRKISFQFACICYGNLDEKKNLYQFFDFDSDVEKLSMFLQADFIPQETGGPGNFAGVLDKALRKLSFRNGMKAIIWFANSDAYGQKYCGYRTGHEEEEQKLDQLVETLARDDFFVVCISENGIANRTFNEMKKIYDENEGVSFVVQSFSPNKGEEINELCEIIIAINDTLLDEILS